MKKNIGNNINIRQKIYKAIKKELSKSDSMRSFRGEIRKQVIDIVRGDECEDQMEDDITIGPCSPTDLLNQLILDYFNWMNLKYSYNMFAIESGTKMKMSKKKLRRRFKNSEDFSKRVPVLLEIMTNSMKACKKK